MNGGKHAGSHGAKAPQVVHKAAVHALGICQVGILHFLGEGVVLEPRQQFQVHGNALVAILRCMHMQVNHGRYQQPVAKVQDLSVPSVQRRQVSRNTCHTAIVTDSYIAVLQHLETVLLLRI